MKKTNRTEIAEYLAKTIQTVSGWKKKQPQLYELTKLGMICVNNNIDEEMLIKLVELHEMIRGQK